MSKRVMNPVFRSSFPLIGTSFVNKSGAIGLSLLPMILVERQFSVAQATWAMVLVKAAHVAGTFLGGLSTDRWGARRTVLASFLVSAFGLAAMPWAPGWAGLVVAGILAQLGSALYHSPARLLLVGLVARNQRQEAIAWLRTANNMGQIMSFSIGTLFASLGTALLICFDAATSAIAFVVGLKWLPDPKEESRPAGENNADPKVEWSRWRLFLLSTFVVAGFGFLEEMFFGGAAGLYRLHFGPSGLRVFSSSMVVNTTLCTIFSVHASRVFRDPGRVLPGGLFLIALGAALAVQWPSSVPLIYIGMFVLSVGEIFFASLSQYVLIQILPAVGSQGSIYGFSLTLQVLGRITGAGFAFPWVVHGAHPGGMFLVGVIPFLLVSYATRTELRKILSEGV